MTSKTTATPRIKRSVTHSTFVIERDDDASPARVFHAFADPKAKAQWLNVHKVVISRSLDKVEWNNTELIGGNVAEEIAKLKALPGQNLMIFGSPRVVHLLGQLGLVDEYRLNVSPVVLGKGIPMFEGYEAKLKLLNARTFASGVVALHYATVRE